MVSTPKQPASQKAATAVSSRRAGRVMRRPRNRPGPCRLIAGSTTEKRSGEDVLDPLENVAAGGLRRVLVLAKRLEELALALAETGGNLEAHGGVEVAARAAVRMRHPLAAQAQNGSRLGAGGDADRLVPLERRNLHLAAERRQGDRDRRLHLEIGPVTPEQRVILDLDHHVQVAGPAPVNAPLALPGDAQAHPAVDPGGNPDLDMAFLAPTPLAATGLAGVLDDLAAAGTRPARPTERKKALLVNDLAAAAARA